MTPGLVEFLLARIAEDEVLARTATAGPWSAEGESGDVAPWREPWVSARQDAAVTQHPDGGQPNGSVRSYGDAEHIARWDPARALAECDAKREIVKTACGALRWVGDDGRVAERTGVYIDPDAVEGIEARAEVWGQVLDLLAVPYVTHPDYRPRIAPPR